MTRNQNDSRMQNFAVVEQERTCRVVHLIIWLSIFVRVRIFWTSNIFVIIVFPCTHDTGAVAGTEPGDEFYTLPLGTSLLLPAGGPVIFRGGGRNLFW